MNNLDPHTRNYPEGQSVAWQVVFWRGNVASGAKGADRAELQQFVKGLGFHMVGSFKLPDDGPRMEAWLRALELAHASGKDQMRRDFREFIGASQ